MMTGGPRRHQQGVGSLMMIYDVGFETSPAKGWASQAERNDDLGWEVPKRHCRRGGSSLGAP